MTVPRWLPRDGSAGRSPTPITRPRAATFVSTEAMSSVARLRLRRSAADWHTPRSRPARAVLVDQVRDRHRPSTTIHCCSSITGSSSGTSRGDRGCYGPPSCCSIRPLARASWSTSRSRGRRSGSRVCPGLTSPSSPGSHRLGSWKRPHARSPRCRSRLARFPWFRGGHTDPWNHVECAMALSAAGLVVEAERAYDWLRRGQRPDGSWPSRVRAGTVEDPNADTNQCAYVAVGVWHHLLGHGDRQFGMRMWPIVRNAISFAVDLQTGRGEFRGLTASTGRPPTRLCLPAAQARIRASAAPSPSPSGSVTPGPRGSSRRAAWRTSSPNTRRRSLKRTGFRWTGTTRCLEAR